MKLLRSIVAWLGAMIILLLRLTIRARFFNDPRPELRAAGRTYAVALLHGHQLAGVLANDEPVCHIMVSASSDGDLIVPSLKVRNVVPVRGSTRKGNRDKGGGRALKKIREGLEKGVPAMLTVDGPRGPRNTVHRGIASLASSTGAVIVPVVALPSRRFIFQRAWDRFQLPLPFCRIDVQFAPPIYPEGADDDTLRTQVADALNGLERRFDPAEAAAARR